MSVPRLPTYFLSHGAGPWSIHWFPSVPIPPGIGMGQLPPGFDQRLLQRRKLLAEGDQGKGAPA
jgi:hypothetical protein